MTTKKRTVIVKQLPFSPDPRQTLHFLEEVQSSMAQRRPCLVLDCASLRELDEATIHLMLQCLEEALRRNGDVRLAALPSSAEAAFAAAGLERLFDHYNTAAEAVASFHQGPLSSALPAAAVAPLQAAEAA
ncbi:MAG: STAS domain-containing protein [Acidobacteriaceae bacterium]